MKLPEALRSEMGHKTILSHRKLTGQLRFFWEFMGVHGCEGYGFRMGKKWKWPKTYQKLDLWSHYRYQSHCFVDPLLFQ